MNKSVKNIVIVVAGVLVIAGLVVALVKGINKSK